MPNRALRPRSRFQVSTPFCLRVCERTVASEERSRCILGAPNRATFPGPGFPPERRTVSPGAKRSTSPEGVSLMDETSNRSVC